MKVLKNNSVLWAVLLSANCAVVPASSGAAQFTWQLTMGQPNIRIALPMTDILLGDKDQSLVLFLPSTAVGKEEAFYFIRVAVYCPDGETLLKESSLSEFPVGAGGRFILRLPHVKTQCQGLSPESVLAVALSLEFVDAPYPMQLQGRIGWRR